jgi:hypothetical protein
VPQFDVHPNNVSEKSVSQRRIQHSLYISNVS